MLTASIIALMMEEVITPETSVNFYKNTRRNTPEDSHLHTPRREKLKSSVVNVKLHNKQRLQ
jgi:hypothetical protein